VFERNLSPVISLFFFPFFFLQRPLFTYYNFSAAAYAIQDLPDRSTLLYSPATFLSRARGTTLPAPPRKLPP